jgi:uncharacterized protein (DUF983 family)
MPHSTTETLPSAAMSGSESNPPSAAAAFINHKCPRCRKGNLYQTSVFSTQFGKMHTDCDHCGLHFEREPGFFWGAMYFSYAYNVAIFLACFLLLRFAFGDPSIWVYLVTIFSASAILSPVSIRYSRTAMLYMFGGVKFNSEAWRKGKRA